MANDRPDQEPGVPLKGPPAPVTKGRQSFSSLRRDLNEEELSSSAVQRLLLDDIERLEREAVELKDFREKFHQADKHCGILEERGKRVTASEIISMSCLAVGAAALGYAPAVWKQQPSGYILLTFGGLLILGGVLAKLAVHWGKNK